MQPVNVLPVFVSQDTDLKSKESSGTSADSNKDTDFFSLVEQHLPEEIKLNSQKKIVSFEQKTTVIDDKPIAGNDKSEVDEVKSSQERHSKEPVDRSNTSKDASLAAINTSKDAPLAAINTSKDASLAAGITSKDATLAAINTSKDAPLAAINTSKGAPLAAINTSKDAPLAASNTSKDASLAASNTSKDAPLAAINTSKDVPLAASNTSKDAPLAAINTSKDAPLVASNTSKDVPLAASNTSKDASLAASNTSKNAPLAASNTSKDAALAASNTSKNAALATSNISKDALPNNGTLIESEQFIALLYNSDQTLAENSGKSKAANEISNANSGQVNDIDINVDDATINSKNGKAKVVVLSSSQDNPVLTSEHKLKVFSNDQLPAVTQLKNNNTVVMQSSSQVLKDYQLSLHSQQSVIKSKSITSQQLMDAQLANKQLSNNKITDVASGVALASKSQPTEQVDIGLYQLSVEEVDKEESITDDTSPSTKESAVKRDMNQSENKTSSLIKPQAEIDTDLASKVNEQTVVSSTKTFDSSTEIKEVNTSNRDPVISQLSTANVDKLIVGQNLPTSVENIPKEQPMMKQSQLQVLQQVQAQQQLQSVISEQQAIEEVGEEFIDAILLVEDKSIEPGVKASSKVFDNIAMRSVSDIQNQTLQAIQTRQSNTAYLEHQVSEVLNHNIASDTVQIQKNNILLQQETVSIFRKDFADAVKDKVMMTINQKLQRFDITLDPPEFGNMQVRVNLQGEQASVNFVVQNQQAKDALEQNMHKLRDMLSEQGVDVGDANVEQQNQQQNNNEQKSPQNNDSNTALINGVQKDEYNVEHTLSAKLFDSSATRVDYYA
jgi:flagellar hook-length control protein FliK